MDIITWTAHTDASLPLMANSLEHTWYYARTCFSHAFYYVVRILYFYFLNHGIEIPPPSNHPLKIKWGDFGDHSTERRRTVQWPGNCRCNQRRTQIPYLT